MKDGIHPDYIHTVVRCGCGNTFATRSTVPEIKVDICNVCHPFFTGKLKFVDTAGRIEMPASRRRRPPKRPLPNSGPEACWRTLALGPGWLTQAPESSGFSEGRAVAIHG